MRDLSYLSNFYAAQVYKFLTADLKGMESMVDIPCNLDLESNLVETVLDIYHRDKWNLILTGLITDLIVGNAVRTMEALGYSVIANSNRFRRVDFKPFVNFGNAFRLAEFTRIPEYDFDMYIAAVNCRKFEYPDYLDNDFDDWDYDEDQDFDSGSGFRCEDINQCFKIYEAILNGFISICNELKIRCKELRSNAISNSAFITSSELETAIRQVQNYNDQLDKLQDWRLQMISRLNLIASRQFRLVRFKDAQPDPSSVSDVDDMLFSAMHELIAYTAKYALVGLQDLSTKLHKEELPARKQASSKTSNSDFIDKSKNDLSDTEDHDTHLF